MTCFNYVSTRRAVSTACNFRRHLLQLCCRCGRDLLLFRKAAERCSALLGIFALCSRKVAGTIPDGVIGIFHLSNPSGRIMILGSTQPLTEMSTRSISWGVNATDV